jgi:hypothetical protein
MPQRHVCCKNINFTYTEIYLTNIVNLIVYCNDTDWLCLDVHMND